MWKNSKQFRKLSPRVKGYMRIFSRVLLLTVLVYVLFLLTARALRKIAIAQISEMVDTKVTAESLDFGFDGSVLVKNLVVRPRQRAEYDNTIFKARTVYAHFGLASVLLFRPQLKTITVENFVFDVQFDLDTGTWNTASLKFKTAASAGGKIPFIFLENGMLRYSKVSNSRCKTIAAIPLDAVLKPAEITENACVFNLTTGARSTFGRNVLNGFWRPGIVTVAGGIASADIPVFERVWKINVLAAEIKYDHARNFALNLKIKDLQNKHAAPGPSADLENILFPEKLAALKPLQKFFNRFGPTGQADLELRSVGNLKNPNETRVTGKLYCRDICICDRKFPYTVEHIEGWVDFTEDGVILNNLIGSHGDVDLAFNGSIEQLGQNRRYQIQITSENMVLDDDLYRALSRKKQKLWSDFALAGTAAINFCISRQAHEYTERVLAVKLLNVQATYRHFPYPLKNLTGTLLFQRDTTTVSTLLSRQNNRKIDLSGKVTHRAGELPAYDILIKAENVPLDHTLAAALPTEESQFCTQLADTGLLNIEKLTGKVWSQSQTRRPCYHLSLKTNQFQVRNDVIKLLPTTMKNVVTSLRPAGNISLAADLTRDPADGKLDYEVTVNCLKNSANFDKLPYPLTDICGTLIVNKNGATLNNITATVADSIQIAPDIPAVKLSGRIVFAENNKTSAHLQLIASDIPLDRKFGLALPENLRAAYRKLSPTGRLDLKQVNLEISNAQGEGSNIDFDGQIELKNCSLDTNPLITELNAKFDKIRGSYKPGAGLEATTAELVTADFRLKGKLLTNVRTDNIGYRPDRPCWQADGLVADCYNGTLAGKFELQQPDSGIWGYQLQSGFADIDLEQFLLDTEVPEKLTGRSRTAKNDCTSGKMHGSVCAQGRLGSPDSRIGRCRLEITDMKLGKLSPLVKLLNVLKLTHTTDFAFEQMLVDSYIKHDKVFFQKLDIAGRALAFNGSGFMGLKNNRLDLTLTARGRRLASSEPDVLQSLSEDLGRGVVRIDVSGSLYDPQVTTTTLPVIKQSLQILGTKPIQPNG